MDEKRADDDGVREVEQQHDDPPSVSGCRGHVDVVEHELLRRRHPVD